LIDGTYATASPPPPLGGQVCGTTGDRALRVLEQHRAWQLELAAALPTTQSFDIGEIAVLEDDGTLLRPAGPQFSLDVVAAARVFYRTHGDDYEFLCFYAASEIPFVAIPNTSAFAFEINVVQDVQGIGLGLWDYSLDFGSSGRMHSLLNLNSLSAYPSDPFVSFAVTNSTLDILAHEAGHRWVAFAPLDSAGQTTNSLLGAGLSHWNFYFDNQASMLGGNEWQDNGDGSWTSVEATTRYGQLELYMMGFAPADSVGALPVLYDAASCTPPGNYTVNHHPLDGITCDAREHVFTLSDVVAANGPRVPDVASSPKHHRFAFVLVIPNGSTAAAADLAKLDTIRTEWPAYFSQITSGLATADVTLDSQAGQVAIAHTGLKDTEDTASPRRVTAAVGIDQGSIPIGVDASSVTLHYGINGGGLTPLIMSEMGAGVFEASIPAQAAGTDVRYAVFAASDSSGIESWWPGDDSDSTHLFFVGEDLLPPDVDHLTGSAERKHGKNPNLFHALATDNLGVDRVVATYRWNGGPPDSVTMNRIGVSDTFYVDLMPAALIGDELQLELAAVDSSAAAHRALSPGCAAMGSCTFVWGVDWFEPLDLTDGGFVPSPVTLDWRDSWHWSDQDDVTGRGAWKCGDPGGLHYIPGLDAGLVTCPVPVTQNAELRFRHRYDLEEAAPGQAWDGAVVEMSVSGGAWQSITPVGGYPAVMFEFSGTPLPPGTPVYTGRSAGWETQSFGQAVFPLAGVDSATVRFRLRMVADSFVGAGGWFVDDLELHMDLAGVGAGDPIASSETHFLAPQPNPSHGKVRFAADLSVAAEVRLDIYDIRGRRISSPFAGKARAGRWSLEWNPGSGERGSANLAAGVYLARLRLVFEDGISESLSRRFVVLR
jgi:hypothetical protein